MRLWLLHGEHRESDCSESLQDKTEEKDRSSPKWRSSGNLGSFFTILIGSNSADIVAVPINLHPEPHLWTQTLGNGSSLIQAAKTGLYHSMATIQKTFISKCINYLKC